MIEKIKTVKQFDRIIKGDLVLVDFYADWCDPCKMIAPFLKKLDEKYEELKVYKVDVDKLDVGEIEAMPTFHIYKSGELVSTLKGANKEELEKMIQSAMKVEQLLKH